jgi:hypothetical protein
MEQPTVMSRSKRKLVQAALLGSIAFASVSLSQGANAAPRSYGNPYVQQGPYHEDILPNGTLTGPIAPDANGG